MSDLAKLLDSADSKFAGYLKENKIDPVRVVYASEQIEKFTPADRRIKLAKRLARGKDDDAAKAAKGQKPRTGRPVTLPLVTKAVKGGDVTGPQKSRILRALVRIAEQKKISAPELSNLF